MKAGIPHSPNRAYAFVIVIGGSRCCCLEADFDLVNCLCPAILGLGQAVSWILGLGCIGLTLHMLYFLRFLD